MTQMGMVQWRPFLRDVHTLAGQFHPTHNSRALNIPRLGVGASWLPAVDVYDDTTAIHLEAELPGMRREDIEIRVEHDALVISGKRTPSTLGSETAPRALRSERIYGPFSRTFPLPNTVDMQNIEASYRDGILRVTLPKTEASQPRRIDVNVH